MIFSKIFNEKNQSKKGSAGFTLIELILAASLLGIVITVSGWGLSAILLANERGEAESIITDNLNRALDFISDDVRTANLALSSSQAPTWATDNDKSNSDSSSTDWINQLGSSVAAAAKLYLQIPIIVGSVDPTNDVINITNHDFNNGNAIMFTGSGTAPGGLVKNQVYYVYVDSSDSSYKNKFKVATTLDNANNNTTIDLTNNGNGTIIANKLVIYYNRNSSTTWLKPRTLNRSVGPCTSPFQESNCPALVDALTNAGLTATVSNLRQVTLTLQGRISQSKNPTLTTTAFVRNTEP